jgi:hypothetical protein
MEVNISIIKRREILPQLINPAQIIHKLVREKVVHRVQSIHITWYEKTNFHLTGLFYATDNRAHRPHECKDGD